MTLRFMNLIYASKLRDTNVSGIRTTQRSEACVDANSGTHGASNHERGGLGRMTLVFIDIPSPESTKGLPISELCFTVRADQLCQVPA